MSEEENKEAPKYFTEQGDCTDEVKLVFDDGQTLYVSENLLSYASPVFKAMFKHNCREKEEREVKLTEKKYEDVLEFLLCLHPAVQREITKENVLDLAEIAMEYQTELLTGRCKTVMTNWLDSEREYVKTTSINDKTLRKRAAVCLKILHKAIACGHTDCVDYAINIISKFGYGIFSGKLKLLLRGDINGYRSNQSPSRGNYIQDNDNGVEMEADKLFSTLPDAIKYKLLIERLMVCDRNTMY